MRHNPYCFRNALKPWVSFQSILCGEHSLSLQNFKWERAFTLQLYLLSLVGFFVLLKNKRKKERKDFDLFYVIFLGLCFQVFFSILSMTQLNKPSFSIYFTTSKTKTLCLSLSLHYIPIFLYVYVCIAIFNVLCCVVSCVVWVIASDFTSLFIIPLRLCLTIPIPLSKIRIRLDFQQLAPSRAYSLRVC